MHMYVYVSMLFQQDNLFYMDSSTGSQWPSSLQYLAAAVIALMYVVNKNVYDLLKEARRRLVAAFVRQ